MHNCDDEVVVLGRWRAGSPERQSGAVDAALAAWDAVGWPCGLRSYTALAAEDGTSVLHLSRWRDDQAARGFTAASRTRWATAVDEAVPGLDRVGVEAYYRHGGVRFGDGEPGCLVLVDIDAADAATARGVDGRDAHPQSRRDTRAGTARGHVPPRAPRRHSAHCDRMDRHRRTRHHDQR